MLISLNKLHNHRGFGLVFFTFFLTALIAMVALVIDTAHMYITKHELQNIADMASLAAIAAYVDNRFSGASVARAEVERAVQRVVDRAWLRPDQPFSIESDNIIPGIYEQSFDGNAFTPKTYGDPDVNAIRVEAEMTDDKSLRLLLGPIFGVETTQPYTFATATTISRNILLAIDFSGSTDDVTYSPDSRDALEGMDDEDQSTFRNRAWEDGALPEPLTTILQVAGIFSDPSSGYLTRNDAVGFMGFTGYTYYDGLVFRTDPNGGDIGNKVKYLMDDSGNPVSLSGLSQNLQMLESNTLKQRFDQNINYFDWYRNNRGIGMPNIDGSSDGLVTLSELNVNETPGVSVEDFALLRERGLISSEQAGKFSFLDKNNDGVLVQTEITNIMAPRMLLKFDGLAQLMTASLWSLHFDYNDNSPDQTFYTDNSKLLNTKTDIAAPIAVARDYAFTRTLPLGQIGNAVPILIVISDWHHNVKRNGSDVPVEANYYDYLRRQFDYTEDEMPELKVFGIGTGEMSSHGRRCIQLTERTGGDYWIISGNSPEDISGQLEEAFRVIALQVPYVLVE